MSITTLLFDIDGTLVDSNDFHVTAWQEVFAQAGHELTRELIHGQVGKGGDNLLPTLLPDLSEEEQEALAKAHGERYKGRYMGQVRPFPGARDLLVRSKEAGLTVALATSASAEERDHYLELLDAHDLVDLSTSKDDVESSKPSPDIFAAAVAKAGVRPDQALVIGDTPYDVIAATRAGIGTIALLSGGFPEQELREAGALAVYRDPADLLAQFDASPIRLSG
jgi:membrane protein